MRISDSLKFEVNFERVFYFLGLILEKFEGFDLFVVYLNENFSFWYLNDLFVVYSKIRI